MRTMGWIGILIVVWLLPSLAQGVEPGIDLAKIEPARTKQELAHPGVYFKDRNLLIRAMSIADITAFAYGVSPTQVVGASSPQRFQVRAMLTVKGPHTKAEQQAMVLDLLMRWFGLHAHRVGQRVVIDALRMP